MFLEDNQRSAPKRIQDRVDKAEEWRIMVCVMEHCTWKTMASTTTNICPTNATTLTQ